MIYRFKITAVFPKDFFRVVEIKDSQTLYILHEHLQNDLGYAPDQMIAFRTLEDKNEYDLFDTGSGSIDTLTMAELKRRRELQLWYVFDLHNDRSLKLELLGEEEEEPRKVYPRTIEEKGNPPDQFDARTPVQRPDDDNDEIDDDGVEEAYDDEA